MLFWEFHRFQLLFWGFSRLFRCVLGAVLEISPVSATFSWNFSGCWTEFRVLFWGFQRFQLLFWGFFRLLGCVLGAVLGISPVSATFLGFFPAVGLDLGCCFRSFRDYSYQRPACYAINLWLLYIMLI